MLHTLILPATCYNHPSTSFITLCCIIGDELTLLLWTPNHYAPLKKPFLMINKAAGKNCESSMKNRPPNPVDLTLKTSQLQITWHRESSSLLDLSAGKVPTLTNGGWGGALCYFAEGRKHLSSTIWVGVTRLHTALKTPLTSICTASQTGGS